MVIGISHVPIHPTKTPVNVLGQQKPKTSLFYYTLVPLHNCHTPCMETPKPDILEPLGERSQLNTVISNEEQRSLLPSSKDTIRCSSLGFPGTAEKLEEIRPVLKNLITFIIKQEISNYLQTLHERK